MKKVILIATVVLFASCEKIVMPKSASADPVDVFETLWKTIDRGYSFFDYKNVDWNSAYQTYRPQIRAEMTDRELFTVCSEMLRILKDGHVNLRAGFSTSYYHDFFLNFPPNFNKEIIDRNYLRGFEVTGPLYHTLLSGNIGYIYYGSFARAFTEEELDAVLTRFNSVAGLKGIIFDVRNNEGGDPANAYRFFKRIARQNTLLYKTKYKNGPAKNDFTEEQESVIEPTADWVNYTGKLAVLTNRKCYSACNFFVAGCKAFRQITIVGDQTGGGGGQPTGFELPNGWSVNFSGSVTTLPDGFIIENGVAPDIAVSLSSADEAAGIDTIIEAAKTLF
ncbi:MAG: S41 family peptidase [Chitinophagaceae bacterium]